MIVRPEDFTAGLVVALAAALLVLAFWAPPGFAAARVPRRGRRRQECEAAEEVGLGRACHTLVTSL